AVKDRNPATRAATVRRRRPGSHGRVRVAAARRSLLAQAGRSRPGTRLAVAQVYLLGVPMDLGAGRRGVDMGPSALRLARLAGALTALGHEVADLGNVDVPVPETLVESPAADHGARYLPAIAATCAATAERLATQVPADALGIALGGDHSISMGTVLGLARGQR